MFRMMHCAVFVSLLAGLPVIAAAQDARPQIAVAHRGASAYAPEHTFYAHDLAMEMDADVLHCDLRLSKDEVPVCIQDATTERTTGGTHPNRVDSYSLGELRLMDFGSWFNSAHPSQARAEYVGADIMPLEEQLDCYLQHNPRMRFYLEIKESAEGRSEAILAALLQRKGLLATGDAGQRVRSSTILVLSAQAASLERMKQLAPTLPTALLFTAPDGSNAAWIASGQGPGYIDVFVPHSSAVTGDPTLVQRFQEGGHDVHVWGVSERQQMDLLLQRGVDGILSAYPDRLRAAIDARGTGIPADARGNPVSFPRGCPGIAGRVTSRQGPGDVWGANGSRGVQRVQAANVAGGGGGGGAWMAAGLPLLVLGRWLHGLRRALMPRASRRNDDGNGRR